MAQEAMRKEGGEPALKGPWPVWVLALSMAAVHALVMATGNQDAILTRFGFSPDDLERGRILPLFTALILHGGWPHVLMNAVAALAFGAAPARLFGLHAKGVAVFFVFYVLCGLAGNLAYAALHAGSPVVLVGASGAVSGLFGAAARLLHRRGPDGVLRLSPLLDRNVLLVGGAFLVVNLVFGLTDLTPGAQGMPVAWEAHLAGFAAGLLLVGPFARLAGRRD